MIDRQRRQRRHLEHPRPAAQRLAYIAERSRVLDRHCAAIGRDPRGITRSAQVLIPYQDPAGARETVLALVAAGLTHVVLSLPRPYPVGVAHWLVEEIITPVRAHLDH